MGGGGLLEEKKRPWFGLILFLCRSYFLCRPSFFYFQMIIFPDSTDPIGDSKEIHSYKSRVLFEEASLPGKENFLRETFTNSTIFILLHHFKFCFLLFFSPRVIYILAYLNYMNQFFLFFSKGFQFCGCFNTNVGRLINQTFQNKYFIKFIVNIIMCIHNALFF